MTSDDDVTVIDGGSPGVPCAGALGEGAVCCLVSPSDADVLNALRAVLSSEKQPAGAVS